MDKLMAIFTMLLLALSFNSAGVLALTEAGEVQTFLVLSRSDGDIHAPYLPDDVQAPYQGDDIQAPFQSDDVQAPLQTDDIQAPVRDA